MRSQPWATKQLAERAERKERSLTDDVIQDGLAGPCAAERLFQRLHRIASMQDTKRRRNRQRTLVVFIQGMAPAAVDARERQTALNTLGVCGSGSDQSVLACADREDRQRGQNGEPSFHAIPARAFTRGRSSIGPYRTANPPNAATHATPARCRSRLLQPGTTVAITRVIAAASTAA